MAESLQSLLEAGLRAGEWTAWGTVWGCADGEIDALFQHSSGLRVYVPVFSNGWIRYRGTGGEWHICYSDGGVSDDSSELDELFDGFAARTPARGWPELRLRVGQWGFDGRDGPRVVGWHREDKVPFAFHRARPLWTRAKKPLPHCSG